MWCDVESVRFKRHRRPGRLASKGWLALQLAAHMGQGRSPFWAHFSVGVHDKYINIYLISFLRSYNIISNSLA